MERDDFFWLVGLLEGEGCFTRQRSQPRKDGTRLVAPRFALVMTDEDVVARVADLLHRHYLPTCVNPSPNASPTWGVNMTGSEARSLFDMLRPHLSTRRRAQIDSVLQQERDSRRQK